VETDAVTAGTGARRRVLLLLNGDTQIDCCRKPDGPDLEYGNKEDETAERGNNSMKTKLRMIGGLLVALICIGYGSLAQQSKTSKAKPPVKKPVETYKVVKTDAEWKKILTPTQYEILRHAGTERAFTGDTWNNHEAGDYKCAGCGNLLFSSKTKFESGTGWPSFYQPISKTAVKNRADGSDGMDRTEVLCSWCGGHLGHVFDDGPAPTGLRYCMNSGAMKFEKAKK